MHQQIADLSMELQATAALQPLLDDLGLEGSTNRSVFVSEEWRHRTSIQGIGTAYLVALIESPWREKPLVVLRTVFPSRETLRHGDLHLDDAAVELLKAHVSRWRRILVSFPAAVRKVRANRRGNKSP